ncbi:MAG: excinuclease ABC subunit UvrB [Dehalococcoidia bacterium]|nr:MAG: excinuclease ABC subunit UvrB [Dehalococcoidia bacterium]
MPQFKIFSDFGLTGDQPQAVDKLLNGLNNGYKRQTLLGVTGSGKTFTIASVIARLQKPTLVISHNKTLAAQLYSEFKEFFPNNAVEYFVSYYDYYQPEAYIPRTDTYIEKEVDINEEIDKLRHASTRALFERRDVIIVASVSCIYGLGEPEEYYSFVLSLKKGGNYRRDEVLHKLVDMQYERNDIDFTRGKFRIRGDTLEIQPSYEEIATRVEFFGDQVQRMLKLDPVTGEFLGEIESTDIYPAKHFVTSREKLLEAVANIRQELAERLNELNKKNKLLEAARLEQRTFFDLEMLVESGYCNGVENYSRHLAQRAAGSPPYTLLDYFPSDFLLIIDESHMTLPQIRGMYNGDRSRKETLVEFGFRLPSALDNRPLNYDEFNNRINQVIYTSATPSEYEYKHSQQVVEQLVRPTGLLEPTIEVKPTQGQVDDLLYQIKLRVNKGERCLATTLTKRLAEQLADYLTEMGIKTHYLHSEIDTLQRVEILRDLRLGIYDVVVGINLLREGLDLPEVSLVAILDADKEGYLRSEGALIQIMGRAARHIDGHVIMYADKTTGSMERAIAETKRRRDIQQVYNKEHGITPQGIKKAIKDITQRVKPVTETKTETVTIPEKKEEVIRLIKELEKQMKAAAKNLEFEKAALLRDRIIMLRREMITSELPR